MSLKKAAFSGVKWTSFASMIVAFVQIGKISVLARILEKSDFGLMALVVFVLGVLSLFMDMGLSTAILHKQNITKSQFSSLFWLNVIFSIVLYVIIYFASDLIASYFGENELGVLLKIMGLAIIFSAIGRQHKTVAQKEFRFKEISVVESSTAIFVFFVALLLAYSDFGVYALVYSTLLQYLIINVYFFFRGIFKAKIGLYCSMREALPFLKIGGFQVGGQILNYFSRDIDILIVGKILGSEVLGGYSLAKQLVFRPIQILNPVLTKVASPLLAKVQKNLEHLSKNYLTLINFVSTINFSVYLFIIIFAEFVVTILYGSEFLNIVFPVRILCIYMMIRAIGNPVGSLVVATGRTDLEFYWNIIVLLVVPISVYFGAHWGINGVVLSILMFRALLFYPSWKFLIWKMLGVSFKNYCKALVPNYKFVFNQLSSTLRKNK